MAQSSYNAALLAYHVLPLENDPTVMRILESDQWLMMISEPQIVSDLTRHPNSVI
jgi:hypothetical protein